MVKLVKLVLEDRHKSLPKRLLNHADGEGLKKISFFHMVMIPAFFFKERMLKKLKKKKKLIKTS